MKKILEKISNVQCALLKKEIPKNGKNTFGNFNYHELKDLLPVIIPLCKKEGLTFIFSFPQGRAEIKVYNSENTADYIVSSVEMGDIEKQPRMNKPQSIGSYMTYFKRYLLENVFLLTSEANIIDSTEMSEAINKQEVKTPALVTSAIKTLRKKGVDVNKENIINFVNNSKANAEIKKNVIKYINENYE